MAANVHLVGSIGLDSSKEVFSTIGELLGDRVKRVPDGEIGSRRLWISYQYPFLRSSPFLKAEDSMVPGGLFPKLRLADGVKPEEIHFGQLGYAREARTSYVDFCRARDKGAMRPGVRFQVCLPTAIAVIAPFCAPEHIQSILPAYEKAMFREVEEICAEIPHRDLAIQWDICIEMVMWDGRFPGVRSIPNMDEIFAAKFAQLSASVPADVELGYHLCYGDLDAKHFIDPEDTRKIVELANLISDNSKRPITWLHLPVPIDRDDDAYFAPLKDLKMAKAGSEIYLGLVHGKDGVEGTTRRMKTARRHLPEFGIATECGMARVRTPALVKELLQVHKGAASAAF
jgi:hypothetical protein